MTSTPHPAPLHLPVVVADFNDHFSPTRRSTRRSGRRIRTPCSSGWPRTRRGTISRGIVRRGTARPRGASRGTTRASSATDASAGQLEHAVAHPRIEYRVGSRGAQRPPGCVGRISSPSRRRCTGCRSTLFFAEVQRVLAPDGLVAVWGYSLPTRVVSRSRPGAPAVPRRDRRALLAARTQDGRRRTTVSVPFPFAEIAVPPFALEQRLTRAGLKAICGRGPQRTGTAPRARTIQSIRSRRC